MSYYKHFLRQGKDSITRSRNENIASRRIEKQGHLTCSYLQLENNPQRIGISMVVCFLPSFQNFISFAYFSLQFMQTLNRNQFKKLLISRDKIIESKLSFRRVSPKHMKNNFCYLEIQRTFIYPSHTSSIRYMTFDAEYFFVTLHEKHITVLPIDWVSIALLLLTSVLR